MKVGDNIVGRDRIKIIRYNLYSDTFECKMGEEHLLLPIYLSSLGIMFPHLDFCLPGDYNDPDHPDHYIRYDLRARPAVYTHPIYGYNINIVLAANFWYTGRYFINEVGKEEQVEVRNAQLHTRTIDYYKSFEGQEHPGELICGIIIGIVGIVSEYQDWTYKGTTKKYKKNVIKDVRQYRTLEEAFAMYDTNDIRIYIQDPGVNRMQYDLPINLIKIL